MIYQMRNFIELSVSKISSIDSCCQHSGIRCMSAFFFCCLFQSLNNNTIGKYFSVFENNEEVTVVYGQRKFWEGEDYFARKNVCCKVVRGGMSVRKKLEIFVSQMPLLSCYLVHALIKKLSCEVRKFFLALQISN